MRAKSDISQSGPFGMADGASDDEKGFISFRTDGNWGDLQLADNSLRERIFVGRRGSGKSRYLREQERAAAGKMLIFKQPTDAISIVNLRRVHAEYTDAAEREEAWIGLWHAAVQLALASFLMKSPEVDKARSSLEDTDVITDLLTRYLGTSRASFSLVEALNLLLKSTEGRRAKVDTLLASSDWRVLESAVAGLVASNRPVAMFVDSLDENFRYAPTENTQAQIALLLYLARGLADPSRSNRAHVFVTVRDIVYSQFTLHEQGQKYSNEVHWKFLDWRRDSARYFFVQKISRLRPTHLHGDAQAENPFERWLGVSSVDNPAREVSETVEDFLLRHTRYLPREIVELGNALCAALANHGSVSARMDIWSLVIAQAHGIGDRAMSVLQDHIISISEESFLTDSARLRYKATLDEGFAIFKSALPAEIISSDDLEMADMLFVDRCGEIDAETRFSDMLWQHGLLGYLYSDETLSGTADVALFYTAAGGLDGNSSFKLPKAQRYRLHASLIDAETMLLDKAIPQIGSVDFGR